VGGGPAGLTTAGALARVGMAATILERGDRVGQSWEDRYDRLHLHTTRNYSGLAHFPIPHSYPKYLSKDQYATYLRDYAAHFKLQVVANTPVRRVRQGHSHSEKGWEVVTDAETWSARMVVIATGQYAVPIRPDWPGLIEYGGQMLHSFQYRSGRDFKDRRVLVVGAGNSGMEIAVDLVEGGAAEVAISLRSAPPIVPRDFLGTPAQMFGILMNSLPASIGDRVGQTFSRLALGNLQHYGLPAPAWRPFSSHRTPVIDVGFVPALKAGRIGLRPAVKAFTPKEVVFQNQQEESFDAVILATGFRSGLENLLEPEGLLDMNGNPQSLSGTASACPGLYFMGYFNSLRGFLYESNLASQHLAQEIRRNVDSKYN
jgi:putative flavoprotein involved in K+ transport